MAGVMSRASLQEGGQRFQEALVLGLRADRDLVLRKETLRLGAGRSAVSMVAPVDGAHVGLPDLAYYASPIVPRSSCQRRWRSAGRTAR